jgi:hypothetical protein
MNRNQEGQKRAERLARIYKMRRNLPDEWWEASIKVWRKTRVPCSCSMCGNPRRMGEKTVQELKADEAMVAQLEEIGA